MSFDEIKFRKRIRERIDTTAVHNTKTLDGTVTSEDVRLDVVAQKVTIQIPSTITVTITGSLNGKDFFSIGAGLTNTAKTYGPGVGEHLVKVVRITRTAGTGIVTVVGA